jgi:hypothetical protein
MLLYILLILTTSYNYSPTVFLDGDLGLHTSNATFRNSGQFKLIFRESYGRKKDKENMSESSQKQVDINFEYTPFTFVEFETAISYLKMEENNYKGLIMKTKIPFLSIGAMKSSISPCFTFSQGDKPYSTLNFDIEVVPFKAKNLPSFIFGQSANIGKIHGEYILQYSLVLSLLSKNFQPFTEFYTELNNNISSMKNSRFSSGLGFRLGNLGLKAGFEIPIEDYTKRNFDYRLTGELSLLVDTKRKPKGSLNLTVVDKETESYITATIIIKGKDIEKILECNYGKCTIGNLSYGIYTIEISNPEFRLLKFPVSINRNSLDRTCKLIKKEKEKGGESSL